MAQEGFHYDDVGVDTERAVSGLGTLARSINATLAFRDGHAFGKPVTGLGYYANVLALPGNQGLAIATDGVGTKIMVAELCGRYDTIPIDMIAMNVNDILCVGAEPFALVDYIAVGKIDDDVFDQIGRGLKLGAEQARITIPGGEIAQVASLLRGHGATKGLDLIGCAVGLVDLDRVNLGQDVVAGDVVVGLEASGLHSNGFTLARHVLLEKGGLALDEEIPELGRTLGDELLEPTRIYVDPILAMRDSGLNLHALLHVTGDGYCNLNRIGADVGFVIDELPEPRPIYELIRRLGDVDDAEMFSVFNMGIGFCVVLPESQAEQAISIAEERGFGASVIGRATDQHRKEVHLPKQGLRGGKGRLARM